MLMDFANAIQRFKIEYGIGMEGVHMYVHPETFEKFYKSMFKQMRLRDKIRVIYSNILAKLKKTKMTVDIDWIPLQTSDMVPKDTIIVVRKPEEVIKYEFRPEYRDALHRS